jgi:putative two-component system response regulator
MTPLSQARTPVLVVDDDPTSLHLVSREVERGGYDPVRAESGVSALEQLRLRPEIRLVLTDWDMDGLDGIELIERIRSDAASEYRFVMAVTGRQKTEEVITALKSGADDVLSKPIVADELLARLRSAERMFGIETRDALLLALAKLAAERDTDTGEHIMRTRLYCRILAEELVLRDPMLPANLPELMFTCSPLHDIGKVGIPDAVLQKDGKLTDEEYETMKRHTTIGSETIRVAIEASSESLPLKTIYDIARSHHERWDGRGYPDGLRGEQIPLTARIMAVADVYDALRSVRCYKDAMTHAQAAEMIRNGAGSQFDPAVVDAFMSRGDEFARISCDAESAYREAA